MKKILLIIVLLIVVGLGFLAYTHFTAPKFVVNSFDDCSKHYPVLESYPQQCKTPDGKSFTQNIGNELELLDKIVLSSPRPLQRVTSPLPISGKARGAWFFEASFPVEVVDANGNSLGKTAIHAQGEWMTEDFVDFKGEIIFKKPTTKTGSLIIKKDNPSGLPENEETLMVPVNF